MPLHCYNKYYILSLGNVTLCPKEQLSVQGNGSVNCTRSDIGLKCNVTCKNGFTFGTSVNISHHIYCRDGVWDYWQEGKEFPDCQSECIQCQISTVMVKR